jgi:hypothetical protein
MAMVTLTKDELKGSSKKMYEKIMEYEKQGILVREPQWDSKVAIEYGGKKTLVGDHLVYRLPKSMKSFGELLMTISTELPEGEVRRDVLMD